MPGQSEEWEKMGTETQGVAEPTGQAWKDERRSRKDCRFQPPVEEAPGKGRRMRLRLRRRLSGGRWELETLRARASKKEKLLL